MNDHARCQFTRFTVTDFFLKYISHDFKSRYQFDLVYQGPLNSLSITGMLFQN